MAPTLVDTIYDANGNLVYETQPHMIGSPIERGTAKSLRILMHDTILYGTCRKPFRKLLRKKHFRRVNMGAKTGTINNENDDLKYDWLTAYAIPPHGMNAICIAVLSIHGEKLGLKAKEIGRYIIDYYLKL
jgi:hypothetical protein